MKKDFLKHWTAIMLAIVTTLGAVSGVYALVVKPNLNNAIKEQVQICKAKTDSLNEVAHSQIVSRLEGIEKRTMKSEVSAWVKLNKKEREEANELYKILGGK
jgi:hypothetical protein